MGQDTGDDPWRCVQGGSSLLSHCRQTSAGEHLQLRNTMLLWGCSSSSIDTFMNQPLLPPLPTQPHPKLPSPLLWAPAQALIPTETPWLGQEQDGYT